MWMQQRGKERKKIKKRIVDRLKCIHNSKTNYKFNQIILGEGKRKSRRRK